MSKSLFKRIGTSVVALSLVISSLSAVTVSAEDSSDFHPSVTYAKGDYTFGKLSHPDKPVSTPDGIVDYLGRKCCRNWREWCYRSGRSGTKLCLVCCFLR